MSEFPALIKTIAGRVGLYVGYFLLKSKDKAKASKIDLDLGLF